MYLHEPKLSVNSSLIFLYNVFSCTQFVSLYTYSYIKFRIFKSEYYFFLEGCLSYLPLCETKTRLEQIKKEIDYLQRQVDGCNGKFEFVGDIYGHNIRLQTRMNQIIDEFNHIAEFQLDNIDVLVNVDNDSFYGAVAKQFLNTEFTLENLEEQLHGQKVTTITATAIGFAVELAISRIAKSLSKHYNEKWQKFVDKVVYDNPHISDNDLDELRRHKKNKTYRIIYAKRTILVFKAIGSSLKGGVKAIVHAPRKIKNAYTFRKFRMSKMFRPFRSRQNFLKAVKSSFNKKLSIGKSISGVVSNAISGIEIFLTHKGYKDLEHKALAALRNYEKFRDNLRNVVDTCERDFASLVTAELKNFTIIAESLKTVMFDQSHTFEINITKTLLPKSIITDTSHYLTKEYGKVNESNIKSEQLKLLTLLENQRFNLKTVRDTLKAIAIWNKQTKKMIFNEYPFQTIRTTLRLIYETHESPIIKHFGHNLTIKKMLCMISLIQFHEETYDFFNLTFFRENCTTNPSSLSITQILANRYETLIKSQVKRYVDDEDSRRGLSKIQDDVAKILNQDSYMIKPYNTTPTKKDILCKIVGLYPKKLIFDCYDLHPFKKQCLTMSDNDFAELELQALIARNTAYIREANGMLHASCLMKTTVSLDTSELTEPTSDDETMKMWKFSQQNSAAHGMKSCRFWSMILVFIVLF